MVIVKYFNLYVPLNQSSNSYRHYGIKHDKLLFFELHEILHIINNDCKKEYPVCIKPYFQMKQNYNLLRPSKYDLKHILKINKFLYDEMSVSCKIWIDKFIDQNVHIIKWEDINDSYLKSLSLKERKMFDVMYNKLKNNEKMFKNNYVATCIETSDVSKKKFKQSSNHEIHLKNIKQNEKEQNFNNRKINTCNSIKITTNLFNMKEQFEDYNVPSVKVLNTLNYLKEEIKINTEINLLEYLYFDVFKTKSDFNRNKEVVLHKMCFINKYVKLKNMIDSLNEKLVCVISNQEYVILKIDRIDVLDKDIDDKLLKK